jgi:hypothetical protein
LRPVSTTLRQAFNNLFKNKVNTRSQQPCHNLFPSLFHKLFNSLASSTR